MKKLLLALPLLALIGCSQSGAQNGASNFLATICANGQTLLTQVPTGILTPQQVQNIQLVACSTAFGTVAAPASAPGQFPIFSPVGPKVVAPAAPVAK